MEVTLGGVLGHSALQVVDLVTTHEPVPAPILPQALEERTALVWVLTERLSSAKSPAVQVTSMKYKIQRMRDI